jgi:transposase
VTARSVGRFFKTEGNSLERAYKHHLSNFEQWDQKAHAEDWVLLAENFGEKMSIDETMLCDDLFTFLSNKAGKGKHGTLAAAVRGTTTEEVVKILTQVPEEIRRQVQEVTMDFSDSMYSIIRQAFPWATIVIDCFHIMQLCGDALGEMRMKLKRTAVAEVKRQERQFKKRLAKNQKQREYYRKKHPKNYSGKTRGRKPLRKNARFTPPKIELEVKGQKVYETKAELLTHVRYPLMKSREKWTDRQEEEMKVLFNLEPRMELAYNLVHRIRCLFKSKVTPEEAKPKLDEWCKDVGKTLIRELISVRDTIKQREPEILNYFTNRSTNASAESLNSKIKGFRAQLRGVHDLPFFMYRLMVIFG